jgi:hypothetical protein
MVAGLLQYHRNGSPNHRLRLPIDNKFSGAYKCKRPNQGAVTWLTRPGNQWVRHRLPSTTTVV